MTTNKKPAIAGPIVSVQKRGRPVHVALVDSNRVFAHGFDVDYPADIHFRTMRHGPFSVLIATQDTVEIRVMMDNQLLCEQRLDPLPQPSFEQGDKSAVRKQVHEQLNAPQPFFVSHKNDGAPLAFTADPQGRSIEERMRLELHPDALLPVNGPATIKHEEPVGHMEAKLDVDPSKFGMVPPPQAAAPTSAPADGATNPGTEGANLGDALSTSNGASNASRPALVVPASAQLPVDEHQAEPGGDYHVELPLPTMASSYGMIAVGVRLVQVPIDGEPPLPLDGFDYVLFQLNTWEDNARVRANLHSRIKLPPKVAYREIDDGTPSSNNHTVHNAGCGCSHGHDPRRFR